MEGLFGKKTEVTAIVDSINNKSDTLFSVLESNDSATTIIDTTVMVSQSDSSTLYGQDIEIKFENNTDTVSNRTKYLDRYGFKQNKIFRFNVCCK